MNFMYGSFPLFKAIQPSVINLKAGLGCYFLDILLRFSPNSPSKGILVVHDLALCVSFGTSKHYLGMATPLVTNGMRGSVAIRPLENSQHDVNVCFRLHLTATALESLEKIRNSSDAIFHIGLQGNITGYDSDIVEPKSRPLEALWSEEILLNAPPAWVYAPKDETESIVLTIPESSWIGLLAKAGFTRTLLLELPVLEGDEIGLASNHIRNAQLAFVQGRYSDVVARCRDALDSIIPKPQCPWKVVGEADTREKMTVEDAFRLSWCAVRQITHASHHRNSLKSEFTRPMAQYVLGAACLALSLASHERDLFAVRQSAR